jgi:hypothetical protein
MREIKGYEGIYAIDKASTIYNIQTGEIKHPTVGNHGYHSIDLYRNGKRKTLLVHRLMAETFIPNPISKRTVNHKDGNKLNNVLSNLEWATYSENNKHSFDKLGRKAYMAGRFGKLNHNSKPILMYSKNGDLLQRYDSIMDAERNVGILNNSIVNCLKQKSKTAGGYKWRYAQ